MAKRIIVDPVTRIEGHLRIDVEVEEGKVSKAWSSGQMWRGIENILKGRDPRDAWAFTQRICGVCTTVHALASVRAVENALELEVPLNAQYIRNIMVSAHALHDHIVHFYHLSALDWVDIVSALEADPKEASKLAESLSSWKLNSVHELTAVQNKLKSFVASGQLGIFANGYWGHKAMKLPPEVNLIAAAHYLQALEIQREANRIVTIMGGKSPHVQNLTVGGDSGLLFPGRNKNKPRDIRKPWCQAVEKANLVDFRFHDLRHSAASYLAMNGATLPEIAEILGHKTLQMVQRYTHLSDSHTSQVIESMNAKLFDA